MTTRDDRCKDRQMDKQRKQTNRQTHKQINYLVNCVSKYKTNLLDANTLLIDGYLLALLTSLFSWPETLLLNEPILFASGKRCDNITIAKKQKLRYLSRRLYLNRKVQMTGELA